jgi:hypothetical protein
MILGKDIHVEKTEFKDKSYVMIRRFYNDDGVMKPGKSGINLSLEEWKEFLENIETIKQEVGDGSN